MGYHAHPSVLVQLIPLVIEHSSLTQDMRLCEDRLLRVSIAALSVSVLTVDGLVQGAQQYRTSIMVTSTRTGGSRKGSEDHQIHRNDPGRTLDQAAAQHTQQTARRMFSSRILSYSEQK